MKEDLPALESLRVDLAALRRRGVDEHEVQAELPVDWLAAALCDTDAEVGEPGSVSLRLLLQPEGVVVVQGAMALRFSVPCGRCLSPAAVDGNTEIFATFMPGAEADEDGPADEDLDPDDDSADVVRYQGPVLLLDALVAEQVALAYPMRALCERGEACRGLCSNCGYELNTLAAEVRRCPQCHGEVPLTPVADPPDETRDERQDNPFAAALSKIELD
ncbi:MAG: DUF177 domain-containing protein [Myxococcales bacterium]|nr:DUF177 domain-containing protein [Myxococcales bacterium]MCB9712625.1 DUF177 domain-containing protein [Myxococcales bacterium]